MNDFDLSLELFDCEISTVEDVAAAATVIFDHGVRFRMLVDDRMRAVEQRETVPELCQRHYTARNVGKRSPHVDWNISCPMALDWFPKLNAHFGFMQTKNFNRLSLTSLLDFEFTDESGYVLPFSRLLTELVEPLVNQCKPQLLRIDRGSRCDRDRKDVRGRKLTWLAWLNVFGPDYVEKYGEDFLLGLPGHATRALANGSVLHQLSPMVMVTSSVEARETRQRAKQYCERHGLKLDCYAPYRMPSPRRRETDSADTLEGFRKFLSQLLGVTLIVDDGTRLKPIALDWSALSQAEHALACEAIIDAVKEDRKAHSSLRLRLEFNELPKHLDEALRSLVGEGHANVEWTVIGRASR